MTPEQRLDRLERIDKLFVNAGLSARRDIRGHDYKINHLVDLQIQNEERFDIGTEIRSTERIARLVNDDAIRAPESRANERRN